MRLTGIWILVTVASLFSNSLAQDAPPKVTLSGIPDGATILVDGLVTASTPDTATKNVSVTFPDDKPHMLSVVKEDYVPLLIGVKPNKEGLPITIKMHFVDPWSWLLSPMSWLMLAFPVLLAFIVGLFMRLETGLFWTAAGMGVLGGVTGLLVGLSQTPVVGVTIPAMLTLATALIGGTAAGTAGVGKAAEETAKVIEKANVGLDAETASKLTKAIQEQNAIQAGAQKRNQQIGSYTLTFGIVFLVGFYLGGFSRSQSEYVSYQRSTYWGLSQRVVSGTSNQTAPNMPSDTGGEPKPGTTASSPPNPDTLPSANVVIVPSGGGLINPAAAFSKFGVPGP
jgi:hypothetical protein